MSEIDWELLDRYLTGEATAAERAQVEAWLAEDPERWSQVAALRDALATAALSDPAVEQAKAEVWARLERELGGAGQGIRPRRQGARDFAVPSHRAWSTPVQIAAALLVTVLGAGVIAALLWRSGPQAPAVRVVATTPGQRTMFRLPDGTRVVLGVASTLRYPAAFDGGPRDVALEGEAYFQVVHDERREFIVRAGNLVAKDLGTEFTVRAYPEDSHARVVVREGRVAIRAAGTDPRAEQVVAPGQLGQMGPGGQPTVEPADTAVYFAWTDGRLVFDRTPLRDALPELSRWFDLDFRLADSASGAIPLSASFKTQPTPDVLSNLAASLGLRERRSGRVVTLYPAEPVR